MREHFKIMTGFTLVELLAVILILGIISLIAIPTVNNIIKESKRGTFESSVQNLISAVETQCQIEQMQGEELTTLYSFTNGIVDNELNVKGKLPSSGTITIDSNCNVTVSVADENFYAWKVSDSDKMKIYEIKTPVSFAEDDWETIIVNVRLGNLSAYKVGDTKEVTLTGNVAGTYTLRIANTSMPAECHTEGFSQTACGFVIEFEDVIAKHVMNSTDTNLGGWETSEMRIYVNDTIYNSLPIELKNIIVDTIVVSGHGLTIGETNFTTIDKIYLLSSQEVWGSNLSWDSANAETRQIDYYSRKGVTSLNYTGAIKKLNGSAKSWWLRTANYGNYGNFYNVDYSGNYYIDSAIGTNWVAPAFRIE